MPEPDHADALAGQLRAVVPGAGTLGEREQRLLVRDHQPEERARVAQADERQAERPLRGRPG